MIANITTKAALVPITATTTISDISSAIGDINLNKNPIYFTIPY